MPLPDQELTTLADAIATAVPVDLLTKVVARQGRVAEYASLLKRANDPVHGRLHGLARAVLDAYNNFDAVHELMLALYRVVDWSPQFRAAAGPYAVPPGMNADQREALYRRRDHFISSPKLMRFAREFEPRVCFVVGEYLDGGHVQSIGGTGFLVAPDMILTAAHVLEKAIAVVGMAQVPKSCAAYFDYVEEPTIRSPSVRRAGVRRVELAADWLVSSSPSLPDDGLVEPLNATRQTSLGQHLDYTLIKLAEPVGLETVGVEGGLRRGWVALPSEDALLGVDSYVNIAQHPDGLPRQVGFGRYAEACPSGTRFWYDTETDHGTSGAPCFTRDCELIGMHNAAYSPAAHPVELNQAVGISKIAEKIRPIVDAAVKDAILTATPIWNVAEAGKQLRLVLGRRRFLSWLEQAAVEIPPSRASRLYAADAPDAGSGKSFSLEILRCLLTRRPEHKLVALGTDVEALPATVEDMIRVLGDHLGVPAKVLDEMPKRPKADLPSDAPDGDKLQRWASDTVPRWFVKALEESRPKARDARDQASAQIDRLQTEGKPIPAELLSLANSPEPILVQDGWRAAWVVLDGITQAKLPAELRDLIAALVGITEEEAALPEVMRQLRWLFLGYRPDFIGHNDVTVELLQANMSADDAAAPLRRAWASRGLLLQEATVTNYCDLFSSVADSVLVDAPAHLRLGRRLINSDTRSLPRRV